jgi:ribosomal protein L19E
MKTPAERFIEKTIPVPFSGCWIWMGAFGNVNGYGNFYLNGKHVGAHRASWLINKGKIPDEMCVCHTCDVRACVNPNHLFIGSQKDNIHDMIKKGRQVVYDMNGIKNPMYGKTHNLITKKLMKEKKEGKYIGALHPRAQINENQVLKIRELKNNGLTNKNISDHLQISFHVVNNIIRGKTWRHV